MLKTHSEKPDLCKPRDCFHQLLLTEPFQKISEIYSQLSQLCKLCDDACSRCNCQDIDCIHTPTPDDSLAPALCRRRFRYRSNLVPRSKLSNKFLHALRSFGTAFCTALHCGHFWTWPQRLSSGISIAPGLRLVKALAASLHSLSSPSTRSLTFGSVESGTCELYRDQDLEASSLRPSDS